MHLPTYISDGAAAALAGGTVAWMVGSFHSLLAQATGIQGPPTDFNAWINLVGNGATVGVLAWHLYYSQTVSGPAKDAIYTTTFREISTANREAHEKTLDRFEKQLELHRTAIEKLREQHNTTNHA